MGKLIEICNSTYKHRPLTEFGKKYHKQLLGDKVICEECILSYITDNAHDLAHIIFNYVNHIKMRELKDSRDEEMHVKIQVPVADTYMQFILPIKFAVDITFLNEDIGSAIKIAKASIGPCPCDNSFKGPDFTFSLDIRNNDSEDGIKNRIKEYLGSFIAATFIKLPDETVQSLMNNASSHNHTSTAPCMNNSIGCSTCSKCNQFAYLETYQYCNNTYCLDCMFDIVSAAAATANITADVGLATDRFPISYAIVSTEDWKRSVISKYIDVMTKMGKNPNITHYRVTPI